MVIAKTTHIPTNSVRMNHSKSATHRKFDSLPELAFEDHRLTSFSGLIVFQVLFARLNLKSALNRCFRHLKVSPIFGHGVVVMAVVVHLLLGYRQLRDLRYCADDPLVRRVLGLTRLPDVATHSRTLAGMDHHSADQMRAMIRRMVGDRLACAGLKRVTVDFDGSVLSTGRFAEGTAVGFNRKKRTNARTVRCFAPSPRPARCSTCGIARAMSMTATVPWASCAPVYVSCASGWGPA